MSPEIIAWLKAGHLIGVFLWIGALFTVYWLLRIHSHAPKAAHEKLTLMERSLALMMDLAAALAIGCGLVSGIDQGKFTAPGSGYMHIKLLVVVVGVLSIHGMLRARIKQFGMGKIKQLPQWQWTMLLVSVMAIMILVTRVKLAMAPAPAAPAAAETAPAPAPEG